MKDDTHGSSRLRKCNSFSRLVASFHAAFRAQRRLTNKKKQRAKQWVAAETTGVSYNPSKVIWSSRGRQANAGSVWGRPEETTSLLRHVKSNADWRHGQNPTAADHIETKLSKGPLKMWFQSFSLFLWLAAKGPWTSGQQAAWHVGSAATLATQQPAGSRKKRWRRSISVNHRGLKLRIKIRRTAHELN